jgi:hypothetical protein
MGWAESPAYFCAATETGRDTIHKSVATNEQLPPHVFESYMHPAQPPKRSLQKDSMYTVSVYLDDFIGAAAKNANGTLLYQITKAALHGIHAIPPPPTNRSRWRKRSNLAEKAPAGWCQLRIRKGDPGVSDGWSSQNGTNLQHQIQGHRWRNSKNSKKKACAT